MWQRYTVFFMMIFFISGIMTVPAFADSNTETKVCKDSHVPVERTNGKIVCLIKETAESTVERFDWKILSGHLAANKHDESLTVSEDMVPTDDSLTKELHLDDITPVQDDSQTESPATAHNVSDAILPNIPPKEYTEQQDTNDPCYDIHDSAFPYKAVKPITYSMTGTGILEKLCVQPHYKWYKIYLDTYTEGSITLEIPKGIVDLKQYDYLDCNPTNYYLDGKDDYKAITVEQIAQSDHSRTLKFTYDRPVSEIGYFDAYGIIDGVDYSGPNYCIKEYEVNNYDPLGHLPWNEPEPEPPKRPCKYKEIDLNYTITNGNVDSMCGTHTAFGVAFRFSNVTQGSELTVDIPWSELHPYYTHKFGNEFFIGDTDLSKWPKCYPSKGLMFRTLEHQTFKIPLLPDADNVVLEFPYEDRFEDEYDDKFSEIMAAVEPFDRSKGNFTEWCNGSDERLIKIIHE